MRKITTLLITLLFNGIIMAQLPTGSFFKFEFTGGNLNNTSTSGAPNFLGSITSIADRNASANNAADITGPLTGASVGVTNVNEMTLSFWMKHDPITLLPSNERILQIYGTGGNGFRLQMDGNQLLYNGKAGNSASPSNSASELVNIDDAAWHHIAIRTTLRATSDTLEFDVFLDNVLQPNISNTTINVSGAITNFLMNANLTISPTNNYSGDIDDICFYKSALTDAEIAQIYFNNNSNCTVTIPDANFKAYLVGNTAINTNGDAEIQCSEASAFTGTIDCSFSSISDLTGIEVFTTLTNLYCHSNSLTSLDISNNINLVRLNGNTNSLTSLNVANGNNSNFTYFQAYNTNLTCIQVDDVAYSTSNWNVGAQTSFSLNCPPVPPCVVTIPDANFKAYLVGNTTINTNGNTEIECSEASAFTGILDCSSQSITDLTGIEAFTALTTLYCQINSLVALDISSNTNLITLLCPFNSLVVLNVSSNTNLITLNCTNNALTNLNVANGNNSNFFGFHATTNPNLTCITVDDVAYSTTNWTSIDAQTSFSTNCGGAVLVNSISVQSIGNANAITTQGGTLQMSATFLPANADDGTYTWSVTNGTGLASIDVNGLLTAITDGTVAITATANDASGVTGTKVITISNQTTTSINEIASQKVNIYPNPVKNQLFVELDSQELTEITIIDYSGKVIKSITNNTTNSIDVSGLSQGIYVLKVSTKASVSANQFVKQ
jgi:hypothetical protein